MGGNQVVFSSINYGTDTSAEGRMVMEELLKATTEGLGNQGEVPVFPIQIFKVKDGVSYSEADYNLAMQDLDAAIEGKIKFETPNFDLFLKACRTTAKALFPNFMFLDTPFNKNEKWKADDPKRYRYELATMGCRTRVFENINGEKTSLGRGNLSFTTMNLPRLAIEAVRQAESLSTDREDKEKKGERTVPAGCRQNVKIHSRTALRALPVPAYSAGTPIPLYDEQRRMERRRQTESQR